MRRALLARVPERVGENEASLGVGVGDLDRLAVRRREDVAGAVRVAAGHVLRRGDDGEHAQRDLQVGDRADARRRPRRRPTCRPSCPPSRSDGFSEMPPVSKVIALPTRPSVTSPLRAVRLVAHDDQARLVVRSLRRPPASAPMPELSIRSRSSASTATLVRRELLRRARRAVPASARSAARSTRSRARFAHSATRAARAPAAAVPSSAADEDETLEGLPVIRLPRAPLPRVVRAEHEPVRRGARLLLDGHRRERDRRRRRACRRRAASRGRRLRQRCGSSRRRRAGPAPRRRGGCRSR